MAGRGSLATAAPNQETCMVKEIRLSIAGGYGETRTHAVYSMGRTEVKFIANGSCGWSPGLED
jgi:hypothetical protein